MTFTECLHQSCADDFMTFTLCCGGLGLLCCCPPQRPPSFRKTWNELYQRMMKRDWWLKCFLILQPRWRPSLWIFLFFKGRQNNSSSPFCIYRKENIYAVVVHKSLMQRDGNTDSTKHTQLKGKCTNCHQEYNQLLYTKPNRHLLSKG